jgi:DNA-binding PadR family transcriptional regulator
MKTHQEQLRQVIEQSMWARPREAPLYRVLRELLDRGELTFTWDEYEGRPIKVWSINNNGSLMHLASDIKDEIQAAVILLFLEGSLVFATDLKATPEVQFRAAKCGPRLV